MRVVAHGRASRMVMMVRRSWRQASSNRDVDDRVRLHHGVHHGGIEAIMPPPVVMAAISLCLVKVNALVTREIVRSTDGVVRIAQGQQVSQLVLRMAAVASLAAHIALILRRIQIPYQVSISNVEIVGLLMNELIILA